MSPRTDTSTDQVVPALNRDAKYSLQPLAVVTKTQSAFAAPFEKPGKVSTEKVATHYPITRPLLPSTNQVSQESFHSNSSLKTAPPVMQSSGWHQQAQSASDQFSMFSGRLNLSESLMVPHPSTGGNSSLRPEELHVAYTRLAARYFEESDKQQQQQQQQQISESIKREHPSFITQSSVKRLELDANFVNYKPRIVLPVGPTLRRPDKERTCATAPEAKRRKINRRRNPVRFLQPSAASRHLTANEKKLTDAVYIEDGKASLDHRVLSEHKGASEPSTTESPVLVPSPDSPELRRSPLENNFVINIRLSEAERKLLGRFRYLYMAAAQRLSDVPPCPEGLRPFPTQSVRLRLDATPESTERKRLLQLLCAGACTQALLLASPTPLDELPSRRPSWAFLPANLPYSFLEQLAEYVRGRDMIVVFPSSSVIERFHLSEELRARGVVCKFFSEPPSWHTLNENGVLLVPSIRPPAGHKQRAYDGVLLPPGVEQWTEITCGSFRIEPDLPSKYLPSVCRNAFVNEHLETLIARMKTVSDHNGLPVTLTSCPGRSLHDVDLCSAQWALIIEPSLELGRARCRVAVKKAFIGLCERLVHVAETSSYKRLTIVVLVPKLCPAINHIACFVRKKVGDRCAIKVVLAETKPLEQQLIELIEESGDDFADYVAHVRRNNEPSACP